MYDALTEKSEYELQLLFKETARLLEEKRVSRQQTALAQIREICETAQLPLGELKAFVKSYAVKSTEASADTLKTYVNPANPQETWDGQGRQPKWIKAILKTGKTLAELEAPAETASE